MALKHGLFRPHLGRGFPIATRSKVLSFLPAHLFGASETGAVYDPSDLSTLWQDSAGTTPVTADGDPVGRIDDKSGNGNHATQTTSTARPLYKTSGGLHWIEGDGVNDFLRAAFAISQPWERVSAIRQVSWTNADAIFCAATVVTGIVQQFGSTPDFRLFSGAGLAATGEVLGQNQILTERHAGASSRVAIDNGAYATGDAGTTAADGITLFAREGAFGANANARCYGLTMYEGTLTDAQIAKLRRYYANKAGVSL